MEQINVIPCEQQPLLVSSLLQELCVMDERSAEMPGERSWSSLGCARGVLRGLLVGTAALISPGIPGKSEQDTSLQLQVETACRKSSD